MRLLDDQLNNLIDSSEPISLHSWNNLLNFYQDNQTKLSEDQILTLYYKSENCRIILNQDVLQKREIIKNGHRLTIDVTVPGLRCTKDEVATNLYSVAERILENNRKKKQENTKIKPNKEKLLLHHSPNKAILI